MTIGGGTGRRGWGVRSEPKRYLKEIGFGILWRRTQIKQKKMKGGGEWGGVAGEVEDGGGARSGGGGGWQERFLVANAEIVG